MLQRIIFLLSVFLMLQSCATYYQRQEDFNNAFYSGNFSKASELLDKNKRAKNKKNVLLYQLNQGTLHFLMGDYAKSNEYFNAADLTAEDYRKSIADAALAYLTNPMTIPYKGEDFELVMIHYYKALNYLYLKNYESALVEARRINLKIQAMNDATKSKNKYSTDAFGLLLMGIIYDASGDANNAFIAYRNAYNAYEETYSKLFSTPAPLQLKKDLLRTAYQTGFMDQVDFYERKFNIKLNAEEFNGKGNLVFFWNNGLGPIKSENSINFTVVGNQGNFNLVNEQLGISFPYYVPAKDTAQRNALSKIKVIRVAFPKYVERKRVYTSAELTIGTKKQSLELAEDINAIAFKSLEDRFTREIFQALSRLALKKATEYAVRKENESVGAAVGIFNALSEKADTRNWQTLPYSISYSRVFLPAGNYPTQFIAKAVSGFNSSTQNFNFEIKANRTTFHSYQTSFSQPLLDRDDRISNNR